MRFGTGFSGLVFSLLMACGDDGSGGAGGAGGGAASGTIVVQISGEELGTDGFGFPQGSEVVIADGWELRFDHVFVTIGKVWLSENPDSSPTDQSVTGDAVAEAAGPWAVDLAKEGEVPGVGGEGTAVVLAELTGQNLKGDVPFAADQRYAFSFSTVAASSAATKVNFGDDGDASDAYDALVAQGCTLAMIGTATFVGGDTCEVSDAAYDFSALPASLPFSLCFAAPVESLNCQNENNQGDPFPDEEFQRGVALQVSQASVAQITLHLDHPFYSDVEHEPVLYFDQFAAQLVGAPPGELLTLDALQGLDPTAFVDGGGAALPWRRCDGGPLPAGAQRAFEAGSIPISPAQDPASGFRDYRDFVTYVTSSLGHMNGGEGICYSDRQYPSPQ